MKYLQLKNRGKLEKFYLTWQLLCFIWSNKCDILCLNYNYVFLLFVPIVLLSCVIFVTRMGRQLGPIAAGFITTAKTPKS